MKDQSRKGLLFQSEDIKIIMQEELCSEKSSKSSMIEEKSSFNLLFLLSPNIHLEAQDCNTSFLFKENQYILHYSAQENTSELWVDNHEILKYFQIQINYQYIFNLINPDSGLESKEILEGMLNNRYIFLHKETPAYMTAEMHIILKEIMSNSKRGVMQKLLIEAKIIKLLILVIEQFHEKNIQDTSPKTATLIKKFVDENFHKNIRIEEMGKLIGINQSTMRKEFKSQYNITITDYISELRMLKAKKMIINKEIMIKEISIECGYEYVQNFTRAFKKKFGLSPEKLRNT
ncbi:helix-turn-helix transcriptional regulator [Chryseobacterium paridis]|uniref:Helix-turn-helix transcriptional regulator n=1 Tax=Chryseobacterium paridis TaxID=2800328 RepID=A0ABS1FRD6_9FLAO|nr:AraC family transcriptional regulator [Chryseobacterium paridis]MBK1894959.1 helix-turn-helix transcriptional regulator [Chryseobacterium paridis]